MATWNDDGSSRLPARPVQSVWLALHRLAYVVSGDLAFPTGLHAGVDFVLLGIFGFHDASTFPALVHVELTGPTTAVGTDGLVMVSLVLLGCLLTVAVGRTWFKRRQTRSVLPRWAGIATPETELTTERPKQTTDTDG